MLLFLETAVDYRNLDVPAVSSCKTCGGKRQVIAHTRENILRLVTYGLLGISSGNRNK